MLCLVPQPGIEPVTLAVEAHSLNHWTTKEVPPKIYFQWWERIINFSWCFLVNTFTPPGEKLFPSPPSAFLSVVGFQLISSPQLMGHSPVFRVHFLCLLQYHLCKYLYSKKGHILSHGV